MTKWNSPIVLDFIKYLGKNPIDAIRDESAYLLRKTNQLGSDILTKGIDIDRISELLQLKEDRYDYNEQLKSSAHLIQKSLDDVRIELSSGKSTFTFYRHRFIIGHEIGHWIIRTKTNRNYTSEEIVQIEKYRYEEELLCHVFALELLMPTNLINPLLKDNQLNSALIDRIYHVFKVPDYHVINRILLSNSELIGIYWKKKPSPTSNYATLRVQNFYPDSRLRSLPYIPINASAKPQRFTPNLILKSYEEKESKSGIIYIEDFGDIHGKYEVFVFNPIKNNTIFDDNKYSRKFDLITILKKHSPKDKLL